MITRIRGTRDIVEGKMLQALSKSLVEHLEQYNYQQIYLPLIEPLALFKRSLGNETDVVSKEMFLVHSSAMEAGEAKDEICLRPEATASTVRAFVENGITTRPWKVYTIGEMFRYERPQKGRFRQFYQCSIESIGIESPAADALFISMLNQFFSKKCGLIEYALHINYLGCPGDRINLKKKLDTFLEQHLEALCATCKRRKDTNILRIFDCKNEHCQSIYINAPTITTTLCESCDHGWKMLQESLDDLSITYMHNSRLVRGLDYYNKTVFEFVSPLLGAQSTFAGGGRYDGLVSAIGGKQDQPSVGVAIGLDRLLLLLEQVNQNFAPQQPPLYIILPLSAAEHTLALHVASLLYTNNFCADVFFESSIKQGLKKANVIGAKMCIIIGENERTATSVMVKNMITGKEELVRQDSLIAYLKQ